MNDMGTWQVQLADGDEGDLADLFPDGDVAVTRGDRGVYLSAQAWGHLDDAADVRRQAAELLDQLNGVARLRRPSHRPPKMGSVERVRGGKRDIYVMPQPAVARARVSLKATLIRSGGTVEEDVTRPGTDTHRLLEAAQASEAGIKAIKLFGLQPSWPNLFKVYEVIWQDLGRQDSKIVAEGLLTNEELRLFKASANWHENPEGRHAARKRGHAKPKRVISISEATTIITKLLNAWLQRMR